LDFMTQRIPASPRDAASLGAKTLALFLVLTVAGGAATASTTGGKPLTRATSLPSTPPLPLPLPQPSSQATAPPHAHLPRSNNASRSATRPEAVKSAGVRGIEESAPLALLLGSLVTLWQAAERNHRNPQSRKLPSNPHQTDHERRCT
jgi:hypothetical protein